MNVIIYQGDDGLAKIVNINPTIFDKTSRLREDLHRQGVLVQRQTIRTEVVKPGLTYHAGENPDGTPKYVTDPDYIDYVEHEEEIIITEQEVWDYLIATTVPEGKVYKLVDPSTLPVTDRAYRDAWEFNGTNVTINVEKAKERHILNKRIKIGKDIYNAKIQGKDKVASDLKTKLDSISLLTKEDITATTFEDVKTTDLEALI